MKYLLTACTFVLTLMVGAQSQSPLDTIVMMKGSKIVVQLESFSSSSVEYSSYINGKGKLINKYGAIDGYRVFSVTKDNERSILYKQDSLIGNFRTVNQMNSFILGQQHAYEFQNTNLAFFGGMAFGAGVSVFDTYLVKKDVGPGDPHGFFTGSPSIAQLIAPFLYSTVMLIPSVRLKTSTVKDKVLLQDIDFQDGYESRAKSRRVIRGLAGSGIGVGVGLLSFFILR